MHAANKHRVVLLKEGHPDYIHASFVNVSNVIILYSRYKIVITCQSYKQKEAYIVTQNPMERTSGVFWQMIVERDCRVIVMLCPMQEDGQVCIPCT